MDSVNASYFKTHFGEVLGRSSRKAVRITRRGHDASVLISEEAYREMQKRAARPPEEALAALQRLQLLADTPPDMPDAQHGDLRTRAILAKHCPEIRFS